MWKKEVLWPSSVGKTLSFLKCAPETGITLVLFGLTKAVGIKISLIPFSSTQVIKPRKAALCTSVSPLPWKPSQDLERLKVPEMSQERSEQTGSNPKLPQAYNYHIRSFALQLYFLTSGHKNTQICLGLRVFLSKLPCHTKFLLKNTNTYLLLIYFWLTVCQLWTFHEKKNFSQQCSLYS